MSNFNDTKKVQHLANLAAVRNHAEHLYLLGNKSISKVELKALGDDLKKIDAEFIKVYFECSKDASLTLNKLGLDIPEAFFTPPSLIESKINVDPPVRDVGKFNTKAIKNKANKNLKASKVKPIEDPKE